MPEPPKTIEAEKLEIEKEKLKYTKTGIQIQTIQILSFVFFSIIGIITTRIIADVMTLLIVLAFFSILFVGILASLPSDKKEGLSIDWDEALMRLEKARYVVEKTSRWSKKRNPSFEASYYQFLRRLYLLAVLEGKKEFAEELWKKGQLPS